MTVSNKDKESKQCFIFLFTTLDFAISSLILFSTTSLKIFPTPVYDKCLKIDSASDFPKLLKNNLEYLSLIYP